MREGIGQRRARRGHGYRHDDIIVFRIAEPPIAGSRACEPLYRIKRIAAVGGDPIPAWLRTRDGVSPCDRVPASHVAVSGDNAVSEDSRHFGFVPEHAIIGFVRSPR